jgi:L-2-hydroxyglutarate oxidase
VIAIKQRSAGSQLITPSHVVEARHVISCAGLYADRLAQLAGSSNSPRIVPFRGDYYLLRPQRSGMVRGLIYPVPDPRERMNTSPM